MTRVLAATAWPENGDLVVDCVELGYLRPEWKTLDPTFGRGIWWKRWRPDDLVAHDLAIDGTDFRDLPYADDTFDAVAFDPPYVCVGGRKTTTVPDLHHRYGLTDAPTSPAAVQALIDQGLAEVARVVRPGGIVLVKCQDYITSGRLWLGTHRTLSHALELGLDVVDRLEHIGGARPQPGNRTRKCPACAGDGCADDDCTAGRIPSRQQHAHRNLSTLFVLRAPRRAHR